MGESKHARLRPPSPDILAWVERLDFTSLSWWERTWIMLKFLLTSEVGSSKHDTTLGPKAMNHCFTSSVLLAHPGLGSIRLCFIQTAGGGAMNNSSQVGTMMSPQVTDFCKGSMRPFCANPRYGWCASGIHCLGWAPPQAGRIRIPAGGTEPPCEILEASRQSGKRNRFTFCPCYLLSELAQLFNLLEAVLLAEVGWVIPHL